MMSRRRRPASWLTSLMGATALASSVTLHLNGLALAQTVAASGAAKATEAQQAIRRGDDAQAIADLTLALADPGLPNETRAIYHNDRGTARVRQQQFRPAIEDFNAAARLYPEYAAIYVNRGSLLLALGQPGEAIKDFERATVLAPNLAAAYNNRAAAYLKLGRADLALADSTRAIELNPRDPVALVGRGRAHLAQKRKHAALRDFSRAISLNPGFVQAYRYRADVRMALGQSEDAAGDLSRALAYDPRRVEDYLARGDAYLAADNVSSALKDYSRVLELKPNAIAGFVGRGYAHAKIGAYDEALDDLAKAIEADPRAARAYAVRAWVYVKMQQPSLGEKDVERLLRLDQNSADTYWAQGELEESLGRGDAASAAYQKALTLHPQHRDVHAALQRIGLDPLREETEIAAAGADRWRIVGAGEEYSAVNEQFGKLRVPLEMMGSGQPKIVEWERKKPPNSSFGLLRFSAGTMTSSAGAEAVENAAIVDVTGGVVLGLFVAKIGTREAKLTWDDGQLNVTGADGFTEEYKLKSRTKEDRDSVAAAGAPVRRVSAPSESSGGASKSSGGTPAWAPWAQSPPSYSPQRETSRPKPKPKSIFDMLFGN